MRLRSRYLELCKRSGSLRRGGKNAVNRVRDFLENFIHFSWDGMSGKLAIFIDERLESSFH